MIGFLVFCLSSDPNLCIEYIMPLPAHHERQVCERAMENVEALARRYSLLEHEPFFVVRSGCRQ